MLEQFIKIGTRVINPRLVADVNLNYLIEWHSKPAETGVLLTFAVPGFEGAFGYSLHGEEGEAARWFFTEGANEIDRDGSQPWKSELCNVVPDIVKAHKLFLASVDKSNTPTV